MPPKHKKSPGWRGVTWLLSPLSTFYVVLRRKKQARKTCAKSKVGVKNAWWGVYWVCSGRKKFARSFSHPLSLVWWCELLVCCAIDALQKKIPEHEIQASRFSVSGRRMPLEPRSETEACRLCQPMRDVSGFCGWMQNRASRWITCLYLQGAYGPQRFYSASFRP